MIDFSKINYLSTGNKRQKSAYEALQSLGIFDTLQSYDPLLAGTIPLGIDLPESDLDIICYCSDEDQFSQELIRHFGDHQEFDIRTLFFGEVKSVVATFFFEDFEIEVFGQNIPSRAQNAYQHMLIEHHILVGRDEHFRKQVIDLKQNGESTEGAFAKLLGLEGDPYEALLNLKIE